MLEKHLIMGTAGHVDHGKTSLIRALTGFDCDTHKEEKQRGITINLGFTHLNLPDGNSIGIVDVPGHADFIKTMVSGACGLDLVLMVIAADEGIMPQTREHLLIMDQLEIKQGLIALTKIDLVDEDLQDLAKEETAEFTKNSFLQDCPVIPVSIINNVGVAQLIEAISNLTANSPERKSRGQFRMYIDRIFSQPGFGTIVNGSILSGEISRQEPVYLLPGGKELRIRRLERHGGEVESVKAGDRAAFNLVGFKQKDFIRGMMLAQQPFQTTSLVDAKLRLFPQKSELSLWTQVIFLLGTIRIMVRIHLLDKNNLQGGEEALVQIYFPREIAVKKGDKFIIRNSSEDDTLGGGEIIDPYPLHHRRRREDQIRIVEKLSSEELSDLITAEVKKSSLPLTQQELAERLEIDPDELIEVIFRQLPPELKFIQGKNQLILMEKKTKTVLENKILSKLAEFHRKNPLIPTGQNFNELMGIFGTEQKDNTRQILQLLLANLVEENKLRENDNKNWSLANHEVSIDKSIMDKIGFIADVITDVDKGFIGINDLELAAAHKQILQQEFQQIIQYLLDQKKIVLLKKHAVASKYLQTVRDKLINYLRTEPSGITVSGYRDLIDSNRACSLLLLEYFDESGITVRKDNIRVLSNRFRQQ